MRDRQIDNRNKVKNEALGLEKTLSNEEIIQDIREKELQERQQKEGSEVLNKQERVKQKDEEKRKEQYQGSKNQYHKRSNKKIESLKRDFKVKEIYSDLREKINPHLKKFTKEKYIYSIKDRDTNRDLKISLTRGQIGTLHEIGRFSVIQKRDFLRHDYKNFKALNKDIKHLLKHNLIRVNVSYTQTKGRIETLSLTEKGEEVLKQLGAIREGERVYSGKIRQREQVFHDSKLYSVFQKRAKEILEKGGKNLKVSLDKELKEKLNREIQKLKKEGKTLEEAKKIASEKMNLPIVKGKVVIPDMQIEYDTREGERASVNIEFATKDYRSGSIQEKAEAGFDIYASKEDAQKLSGYLGGSDTAPLGKPRDLEIFII